MIVLITVLTTYKGKRGGRKRRTGGKSKGRGEGRGGDLFLERGEGRGGEMGIVAS